MQTFERKRSFPSLAVLASLALIAAGCGGNSPSPGVAQAPTSSTTTQPSDDGSASANPAAYSACMRSHGVPKFPDPQPDGGLLLRAGPGTGIDPESPQFKAAAKACEKLSPEGEPPSPAQEAEAQEQMLKFSACMRSHGLPKFPDPQFSEGRASLRLDRSSGLDPNSPQFKAAEKACEKLMPRPPSSSGGESTAP